MTEEKIKKTFILRSAHEAGMLFGAQDENLNAIEEYFNISTFSRGEEFTIQGPADAVKKCALLIEELLRSIRQGHRVTKEDIMATMKLVRSQRPLEMEANYNYKLEVFSKKQYIIPRTPGQRTYVEAMQNYDAVFTIGPAGTGKTYLAMAMAVSWLKAGKVSRIILTRPAVEAGEKLGFLPGDIQDKVNPYLRPLYDALYEMIEMEKIQKFVDSGVIEIAPLAFMRGRTLNDSFVIMDEAQNSTPEQMKMFLTRLGFDSKAIITGDITQSDLPTGKESGLLHAKKILEGIEGIKFVHLTGADTVRHELVQKIIAAYSHFETKKQ
jgi:phosphate starvation-inducible PhoH-like protein